MLDHFEPKKPMLKLVVSNPPKEVSLSETTNSTDSFVSEIRMRSPHDYVLRAHDPFHDLECTVAIEIEKDIDAVICKFSPIIDDQLNEFIEQDETLLGMILIRFQMKIMENILVFCSSQKTKNLLIQVDYNPDGDSLGIYREITCHEDKIPTKNGKIIQMTIPLKPHTSKYWSDLIEEVNQKFSHTLWGDYSSNYSIKRYLKHNPCLNFFQNNNNLER